MTESKTLREKLIEDAEAFCAEQGISKSHLARVVMNHGGFFKRLEEGGDCATGAYEKFQSVFSDPAAWEAAKDERFPKSAA
ncbi:hypothetical protein [Thalassospira lohafexi]|uniref:Uncharacterized protein n=1 Tax=Thalassospira lohafexi TaxID=744227 RepID=A0A2N3L0P1_9PROT|nr:hypothetical protein [Thalassospira lohafexi]PKR56373.1 hypothetical protein COO92_21450 [Thalassospira lohafexi]